MHEPIVLQLVARVLDSGCTPEEACRDSPALLADVRAHLRRIESIDAQLDGLFLAPDSTVGEDQTSALGTVLPHVPGHEVLALLGHGGMGVVYAARNLRLNRTVAVKMLLRGAHADPATWKRLLREAEAVAALRHPNIVQVHEVGEHDGLPYFTMELVDGGSLRDELERGVLDARAAAALVATLAEAIDVAHASGIVHRDLKPANVLFSADGTPKIVDFGIARRIERDSSLTRSGALLGTPSYMAPEQAQARSHAVGPAADVYALGAILYACLTGRPPFEGDMFALTLRQLAEDEPVRPSRRNPRVPRDLETICLECLAKDPARRYASAAALADDLRRFTRGEPIRARPAGHVERAVKWARRRPAHATIVAGAFLGLISVVAAFVWVGIRRAGIERAAEADLVAVDRAAAAADWPAARTALERARARIADGGSGELTARVEHGARELALVEKLDAIRMARADVAFGAVDRARNRKTADSAYARAFRELGLDADSAPPADVAARVRSSRIRAVLVPSLDTWASCVADDDARRDALLQVVRLADPDPTGWRDRVRDPATWEDTTALAASMDAARVPGESVMLLIALAEHVIVAGGDATPFLTRVQQEYPSDFWSNFELGLRLVDRTPAAAVRYFQTAVGVRPDSAVARGNLGSALGASDQRAEAIVQLRKALEIDPGLAQAHASLARCYTLEGRHAEAVDALTSAMRLRPDAANTAMRVHRASLLLELGRLDESTAAFREALQIDPRSYHAHYGLGYALHVAGQLEEACEEQRRAIAIEPRSHAHESLGFVLQLLGRTDESIASFREAVRADPRRTSPREALIEALIASGRFEDARAEAALLLEMHPTGSPGRSAAKALLEHCELVRALEANLPAILDAERTPQDRAECLAFGVLSRARGDHAAATRFFADARARSAGTTSHDDPWRALDGARCAALAGAVGDGAVGTAEAAMRVASRAQAHAWLREELDALAAALASGAPGSRKVVLLGLVELRADPALAGLRDAALLERLPEEERARWGALWSDVDALSARARSDG